MHTKKCCYKNCESVNPQPVSNFYSSKKDSSGYQGYCKNCCKKIGTAWGKKNPRKIKHNQLQIKYKISIDEYEKRLKDQNDCCEICYTHKDEFKYALVVDHNHITGQNRGILCNQCNTALGYLKENENIVSNLLNYIKKYNTKV